MGDAPLWVVILIGLAVPVAGVTGALIGARTARSEGQRGREDQQRSERRAREEQARAQKLEAADAFVRAVNSFLGAAQSAISSLFLQYVLQLDQNEVVKVRSAGDKAVGEMHRVQLLFGVESEVGEATKQIIESVTEVRHALEHMPPDSGAASRGCEVAAERVADFVGRVHATASPNVDA